MPEKVRLVNVSSFYVMEKVKKMYGTNDFNMNLQILLEFDHVKPV